jgi:hypothetical protein
MTPSTGFDWSLHVSREGFLFVGQCFNIFPLFPSLHSKQEGGHVFFRNGQLRSEPRNDLTPPTHPSIYSLPASFKFVGELTCGAPQKRNTAKGFTKRPQWASVREDWPVLGLGAPTYERSPSVKN